ncbi:MAG TPA: hypothetical protein VMF87_04175 [Streptosporangiaceae bacterium]|nr:hypothetical protein [Streptosporangiaceae bacterium]
MLDEQSVGALTPDAAGARDAPSARAAELPHAPQVPGWALPPKPDPVVADSARLRLAALRAKAAAQPENQFAETASARLIKDIRAIGAVLASASGKLGGPAEAIDVGAGLVVLCDLRAHLDHLEAGLLDAAEQAGLSWDVVAAIIGIPADEAQRRHAWLRGREPSP